MRGVQYAWAGNGVSEMLVASGLATVGAGGLEGATRGKETGKETGKAMSEPLLHVPGGLATLKVADAVRITRRANLTSPAAARRVEPFWEWYDYPAKLGGAWGAATPRPRTWQLSALEGQSCVSTGG